MIFLTPKWVPTQCQGIVMTPCVQKVLNKCTFFRPKHSSKLLHNECLKRFSRSRFLENSVKHENTQNTEKFNGICIVGWWAFTLNPKPFASYVCKDMISTKEVHYTAFLNQS